MRTVCDQLAAVLAAVRPVPPLDVVLSDAEGCVLAEDVTVPQDVPVWAVAACDGYAVRSVDVPDGGRRDGHAPDVELPVVHDAAVTSPAPLRLVQRTSILVAAGAPVPAGADAVVPLERTDRGRAHVVVRGGVAAGDHVRRAGHDAAVGSVALRAGTRLAARHLALAAAVGRGRLRVHPAPRVVVVSVGDELVEPGRPRPEGAVFDADGPALVAAVRDVGATAVRVGPVGDDRAVLREVLEDQLVRADLLLVTGGLSPGPWDTVADVLAPLGTVRLDRVAMTPGGRQGFGSVGLGDHGTDQAGPGGTGSAVPVLALPGHPVAALVSFEVFVRPALRAMAGHTELHRPSVRAAATRPWSSPGGRRQLVPASLQGSAAEGHLVTPVGEPRHPSLQALAGADALAVVGEDVTAVRPGDTLRCLVLEG